MCKQDKRNKKTAQYAAWCFSHFLKSVGDCLAWARILVWIALSIHPLFLQSIASYAWLPEGIFMRFRIGLCHYALLGVQEDGPELSVTICKGIRFELWAIKGAYCKFYTIHCSRPSVHLTHIPRWHSRTQGCYTPHQPLANPDGYPLLSGLAEHFWLWANLVDPASSHMLVSKIKPCMSQCKLQYGKTVNGSLKQLQFIWWLLYMDNCGNSRTNTCVQAQLCRRAVFICYRTIAGFAWHVVIHDTWWIVWHQLVMAHSSFWPISFRR